MTGDLPEGWVEVSLASVGDIVTGSTPATKCPEFYGGDIPFVKPGDLAGAVPILRTADSVTEAGVKAGRLLPTGTALVCCIGSLGKVGILGCEGICNQQINAIIPNGSVDSRYLLYWTATLATWLEDVSSETTIRIVNKSRFSGAPIRVAPQAEQRRIVATVEALLEQVNRAKARLDRVPLILKRFRQAVLEEACSGTLTADWRSARKITVDRQAIAGMQNTGELPAGWLTGPLGAVARVHHGFAFSSKRFSEKNSGPVVLTPGNFRPNGVIDLTGGRVVRHDSGYPSEWLLTPGTLVVVMTDLSQKKLLLGVPALVPAGTPILHNQRIGRVERTSPEVRDDYLRLAMLSPSYKRVIDETSTGSLVLHTSPTRLLDAPISLPTLEEQEVICCRVSAMFSLADTIESRVAAVMNRVDAVPQAVLRKAFSGELVPTEAELARAERRSYETAAELLDRVRSHHQIVTIPPPPKSSRPNASRQRHATSRRSSRKRRGRPNGR